MFSKCIATFKSYDTILLIIGLYYSTIFPVLLIHKAYLKCAFRKLEICNRRSRIIFVVQNCRAPNTILVYRGGGGQTDLDGHDFFLLLAKLWSFSPPVCSAEQHLPKCRSFDICISLMLKTTVPSLRAFYGCVEHLLWSKWSHGVILSFTSEAFCLFLSQEASWRVLFFPFSSCEGRSGQ